MITSAFAEWIAVADLMSRKIAHASTTDAILPHEVERWERIRFNALTEAAKHLRGGTQ